MPDITMCSGKNCPLRESCYRYTAPIAGYKQAIWIVAPYDSTLKKCDHYWLAERKTPA
jgi:hypothetical protein